MFLSPGQDYQVAIAARAGLFGNLLSGAGSAISKTAVADKKIPVVQAGILKSKKTRVQKYNPELFCH